MASAMVAEASSLFLPAAASSARSTVRSAATVAPKRSSTFTSTRSLRARSPSSGEVRALSSTLSASVSGARAAFTSPC